VTAKNFPGRNWEADLMKLADAFFKYLTYEDCEFGGWGLDCKRPFGNSSVYPDIWKIIGMEVPTCEHCGEPSKRDWEEKAKDYAYLLYKDLGEFLKAKWQHYRAGSPNYDLVA
jgi:hypothetical protein